MRVNGGGRVTFFYEHKAEKATNFTVSVERLAEFREFSEWARACLPPEGPCTWRTFARKQVVRYRNCKPRVCGHEITIAAYAADVELQIRLTWC